MAKLSKEEADAMITSLQTELAESGIEYPKKKSRQSQADYIEALEALFPDLDDAITLIDEPEVKIKTALVNIKITHSTSIEMTVEGKRTVFKRGDIYAVSHDVAEILLSSNYASLIA